MNNTAPEWLRGGEPTTSIQLPPALPVEQQKSKSKKTYCKEILQRDLKLILISIFLIIIMNITFLHWILYPFSIFSTWIHELCHAIAAILIGGRVLKIELFPDTSGLAYTSIPPDGRGFVATAGYQGTAVVGMLLLLFRRTKRGPRIGLGFLAGAMLLSVIVWIRNAFGIVVMVFLSISLTVCTWKLPSKSMNYLFISVAVMCTLNAITSVQDLFGSSQSVNGVPSESTDAHSMADAVGGTYIMWAFIWLIWAFVMMLIGFLLVIPGPDDDFFGFCGVCTKCGCFDCINKKNRYSSNLPSTGNTDNGVIHVNVY